MTRYAGTRVLFVARQDEETHSHNALRRRALERLGCSVVALDPDQAGWLERLARRDFEGRFGKALESHRPDLVLVIGHTGIDPETLVGLRARHPTKWVNWYPGDLRITKAVKTIATGYDRLYLTGTDIVEELHRLGVTHASYLPLACDPSVHKPLRARGPFRANVVYAGMATPRREELLTELVEFGLAVWGESWRKTSLKDYCRGTLPAVEDYVRAYAGASVAINVHLALDEDPAKQGTGCNQRLFELAAIGVCQVVDARADLPALFEDTREVLVFSNPAELRGQVKRALQEDAYRERLAGAARQRALSAHTYMHRLNTILSDSLGSRTRPIP